jgi:hypothetical protein
MHSSKLTTPMFSLALTRGGSGYLAFGGIPPVKTEGDWAETPIWVTQINEDWNYSFYSIKPDSWIYPGAEPDQTGLYIVDSGSTVSYVDSTVVTSVAAAVVPPAWKNNGFYYVACNAKAPEFGVQIAGKSFMIDAKDMILNLGGTDCVLGFQDARASGITQGTNAIGILGDTFMNNVVAVHDVGAAKMRFIKHVYP